MKEYSYRELEVLRDINTGEKIKVYVPKDEVDRYDEIAYRAYVSGCKFREALRSEALRSEGL